ncbi:MAG: hypothetical protein JSV80_02780 [Acidobacteriota bacterium]|nr:MAG: hypothetical protein JSV80_02780 [Acidobacteriota bacterium]
MIVTDRFVFLAFPRTGTTFVRNALKQLYRRRGLPLLARLGIGHRDQRGWLRELSTPMTDTASAEFEGRRSPHGSFRQIPAEHRGLPVFSSFRNPFDLLVSGFEHRFWQQHPIRDVATLQHKYPGYPDLNFEQYVGMMLDDGVQDILRGKPNQARVGRLTLRFLKFYCREPDAVIDALSDDDVDGHDFSRDLAPVRFVHSENLVAELRQVLADFGVPPERTEFMIGLPRVNVAEARRDRPWTDYYSPKLRERVRHAERLLFRLFPRYDR